MAELVEGGVFAGYRIVRKLGAGGMGQVWLVENPHLERFEAMKVVSTAGAGEDFARRFTAEARTAASLDHPGIVTVYAYGIEGDAAWFTMSYLDGQDLTGVGAVPPAEVAAIVERVAGAVDYANARGVIHRDIKPANVIVRRDPEGRIDRVTVLDFGIAKLMDGTNLTATNAFIGTLTYAPPESLTGGGAVPQSDQYSLAATAYQLLTGRPPFAGGNPGALMMAHITGPVPRPGDAFAAFAPLDGVFGRALQKAPEARYESSGAFAGALGDAVGDLAAPPSRIVSPDPNSAETIRRSAVDPDATAIPDAEATARISGSAAGNRLSSGSASSNPSQRRFGPLAIGAIAVVLLLAIAGGVYAIGGGRNGTETASASSSSAAPAPSTSLGAAPQGPTRDLAAQTLSAAPGGTICATIKGGQAYCWLGPTPRAVAGLPTVDRISSTIDTCAISRGDLFCWGSSALNPANKGQSNFLSEASKPSLVPEVQGATDISLGILDACASAANGVYCWGGAGRPAVPTLVPGVPAAKAVSVGSTACAIAAGGLWCWKSGPNPRASRVTGLGDVTAVSVGSAMICAISDGDVYCWGTAEIAGTRLNGKADKPTRMPEFGKVTAITVSNAAVPKGSICAISNGRVLCMGDNSNGQLGDGTTTGRTGTVTVQGVEGATAVTAGTNSACAATETRTYCWGKTALGRASSGPAPAVVQFPAN